MLVLDKVHAGYGAIEVLKDLTLEVNPGEIVTLLGAKRRRQKHDAADPGGASCRCAAGA